MMTNRTNVFIGCDSTYEQSEIVLFGAPFDSTASFRPGSRFASVAIRNESYGIETFSLQLEKDLINAAVFDAGDLELPFGNAQKAIEMVEKQTQEILRNGKRPFLIGGEHLVTLGGVRAAATRYPDLHIVHFDAHLDMRDEYLGEKLSHSTVMRRCSEIVGSNKIFQFGIRSADKGEWEEARHITKTCKFNFCELDDTVNHLKGKPIYFTLDLDVLDPGVFPGTGTPEAGGVSYKELIEAIVKVSSLNVVALDITELAPNLDPSGVSTALACKVIRETLLSIT